MTVTPQARAAADILTHLDVGSSVAEFDANLQRYFLETEPFRALVEDRCDIVAGDKGTGKTAIFKILLARYRNYDGLRNVEVIPGFNVAGAPVFQQLLETDALDELSYIGMWKSYILALAGNYMLELAGGPVTNELAILDGLLRSAGLRTMDDSPQTVFSKLATRLKRLSSPSGAEGAFAIDPTSGVPVWSVKLEFDSPDDARRFVDFERHDDALGLLDRIVATWDVQLWIALDRLDEAFPARPGLERAALRALFRTYLEIQNLTSLRLKLFVRRDLFAKVTEGGFVNLTHVNARRIDIEWEDDDLYRLLVERIQDQQSFVAAASLEGASSEETFARLFPDQVDQGGGKPKTWRWMLSRVSDGNGVRPPRNLIDLVTRAKEAQLRAEKRNPRNGSPGVPLIESEALKKGLEALSSLRVEDTLLAEAADLNPYVERFRGGKAEHNDESLRAVLRTDDPTVVKRLVGIGFLERVATSYKIPMLYRPGLSVTQGKAFD